LKKSIDMLGNYVHATFGESKNKKKKNSKRSNKDNNEGANTLATDRSKESDEHKSDANNQKAARLMTTMNPTSWSKEM